MKVITEEMKEILVEMNIGKLFFDEYIKIKGNEKFLLFVVIFSVQKCILKLVKCSLFY